MTRKLIPKFNVTNERTTEAATKDVLFSHENTWKTPEFKFHKKTPVVE